jgi:hypothetical protein
VVEYEAYGGAMRRGNGTRHGVGHGVGTQPHLPIPAAVWPDSDERFEIIETPGITGIEGQG